MASIWISPYWQERGHGDEYYFLQLYKSWYIRSFFGFTFWNILYFFKYSCTNIFHRRSLYTFYKVWSEITYPSPSHILLGLLLLIIRNQGHYYLLSLVNAIAHGNGNVAKLHYFITQGYRFNFTCRHKRRQKAIMIISGIDYNLKR